MQDYKNLVSHEARRGEIVDRIVGWIVFGLIVLILTTDIIERTAG